MATTKKRAALTKKSHPLDCPPETTHAPTAKNTKVNTIPKDRSEDTLISSSLSRFSCIFFRRIRGENNELEIFDIVGADERT